MADHPVDHHVGTRIRQRRALLGMSQTSFGQAVGLTFQQIQKYENGSNRVSASRLYEFGKVLDVPVDYFFEGSPEGTQKRRGRPPKEPREDADGFLTKRETLQLVRAYYKIREPGVRRHIAETIKALAKG